MCANMVVMVVVVEGGEEEEGEVVVQIGLPFSIPFLFASWGLLIWMMKPYDIVLFFVTFRILISL
jgi:hypothetical protein